MRFKYYGIILLVGIGIGFGAGFKVFNRPEQPAAPSVATEDKSKQKKSGTIVKYLPSKCDGSPQEISSVEQFDSATENDISLTPDQDKNAISYMPKYSFKDGKIYHAGAYSYGTYGVYLAENSELGAIFTFRW